jgi:hypothetical protein
VPTLIEECIDGLTPLMADQAYRIDGIWAGRFEKVERDHRIVGIFDGSTAVNQHSLINQFDRLSRQFRRNRVDIEGLSAAVRLGAPLPPLQPNAFRVVSRNGCSVMQAMADPAAITGLATAPPPVRTMVENLAARIREVHEALGAGARPQRDPPAEAFELARSYETCFAAAACVLLWAANHERVPDGAAAVSWRAGIWLLAGLNLLLGRLDGVDESDERLAVRLCDAVTSSRRPDVSVLPDHLGEPR